MINIAYIIQIKPLILLKYFFLLAVISVNLKLTSTFNSNTNDDDIDEESSNLEYMENHRRDQDYNSNSFYFGNLNRPVDSTEYLVNPRRAINLLYEENKNLVNVESNFKTITNDNDNDSPNGFDVSSLSQSQLLTNNTNISEYQQNNRSNDGSMTSQNSNIENLIDNLGGNYRFCAGSYGRCVLLSILLGLLIICTIIGNSFVIAAVILERNLHSVANYLIVSLAVADLTVSVMVMPMGAYQEVSHSWALGSILCDIWTSFDVLCCTASILHLVAIALDRYWAITNLYYGAKRTAKRIFTMIIIIWTISTIMGVSPHLFGLSSDESNKDRCQLTNNLTYQLVSTLGAFYLPLIVMCIIYWKIFQSAKFRIRSKGLNSSTTGASSKSVSKAKRHGRQNNHSSYNHLSNNNGVKEIKSEKTNTNSGKCIQLEHSSSLNKLNNETSFVDNNDKQINVISRISDKNKTNRNNSLKAELPPTTIIIDDGDNSTRKKVSISFKQSAKIIHDHSSTSSSTSSSSSASSLSSPSSLSPIPVVPKTPSAARTNLKKIIFKNKFLIKHVALLQEKNVSTKKQLFGENKDLGVTEDHTKSSQDEIRLEIIDKDPKLIENQKPGSQIGEKNETIGQPNMKIIVSNNTPTKEEIFDDKNLDPNPKCIRKRASNDNTAYLMITDNSPNLNTMTAKSQTILFVSNQSNACANNKENNELSSSQKQSIKQPAMCKDSTLNDLNQSQLLNLKTEYALSEYDILGSSNWSIEYKVSKDDENETLPKRDISKISFENENNKNKIRKISFKESLKEEKKGSQCSINKMVTKTDQSEKTIPISTSITTSIPSSEVTERSVSTQTTRGSLSKHKFKKDSIKLNLNKKNSLAKPSEDLAQSPDKVIKKIAVLDEATPVPNSPTAVAFTMNSKSKPIADLMRKKAKIDIRRERKAAKTLGVIMTCFIVCWLPFFVMQILFSICKDCYITILIEKSGMVTILTWSGYCNSLLNPVIYTIFSPDFRSAFAKILFGKYHLKR